MEKSIKNLPHSGYFLSGHLKFASVQDTMHTSVHEAKNEGAPGNGPVPLCFILWSVFDRKIKLFNALERGPVKLTKLLPHSPASSNLHSGLVMP